MATTRSTPDPAARTADTDAEVGAADAHDLLGRRLHFVGIGGSGMSGLARLAAQRGAVCTGSDRGDSDAVRSLRDLGVDVVLRQTAESLPAQVHTLVISAAIAPDHPEVVEARRRGVEVVKYAAMLGRLMADPSTVGVAIAGTHGKSTTTSILCHILIQAGLDPSFIVGAHCAQIGGGSRAGGGLGSGRWGLGSGGDQEDLARSALSPASAPTAPTSLPTAQLPPPPHDILIAEACEYDRSFHNFRPAHAVILNIEADHLDLYKSIDEIVESFATFARLIGEGPAQSRGIAIPRPSGDPGEESGGTSRGTFGDTSGGTSGGNSGGGSLLIQHESPHRLSLIAGLDCEVETIGFAPQADWWVDVMADDQPRVAEAAQRPARKVRLIHDGASVCEWRSPMPGDHFAYNAAAAAVTAHRLGASWDDIARAIAGFQGLDRRMQLIGYLDADRPLPPSTSPVPPSAITIIDDYGHHPTEVDTTLRALRQHHQPRRLICVFQPHQHSRTRHLMEQFAVSFGEADIVIVPEIYFVRDSENERQAVTAGALVDRLRKQGVTAMHLHPFDAIVEQLRVMTKPGDLIVTMGAGDVWKIGRALWDQMQPSP